jgi:hypothetical protein
MTMFDPLMTSVSLGWFLLVAGIISALVIEPIKPRIHLTCRFRPESSAGTLRIVACYTMVFGCVVHFACLLWALLIQADHNWLPFQKPHFYTSEINTNQPRTGPAGFGYAAAARTKAPSAVSSLLISQEVSIERLRAPNPSTPGNSLPKSEARRSITFAPALNCLTFGYLSPDLPVKEHEFVPESAELHVLVLIAHGREHRRLPCRSIGHSGLL